MDFEAFEMIASRKSGALFSLPLNLVLTATGNQNFLEYASVTGKEFAIGYQILDDVKDYCDDIGRRQDRTVLNAVHVLQIQDGINYEHARKRALNKAKKAFKRAILSANALPNQCAQMLVEKAKSLIIFADCTLADA